MVKMVTFRVKEQNSVFHMVTFSNIFLIYCQNRAQFYKAGFHLIQISFLEQVMLQTWDQQVWNHFLLTNQFSGP